MKITCISTVNMTSDKVADLLFVNDNKTCMEIFPEITDIVYIKGDPSKTVVGNIISYNRKIKNKNEKITSEITEYIPGEKIQVIGSNQYQFLYKFISSISLQGHGKQTTITFSSHIKFNPIFYILEPALVKKNSQAYIANVNRISKYLDKDCSLDNKMIKATVMGLSMPSKFVQFLIFCLLVVTAAIILPKRIYWFLSCGLLLNFALILIYIIWIEVTQKIKNSPMKI